MGDLSLNISAVDRGAQRLVKDLTAALRMLASAQAQQAQQSRVQAQQTKAAADNLSNQARLAREAATAEQNRLRVIQEATRERIRQIRLERDEAVQAARVMAKAQNDMALGFKRQAEERLKAAQNIARTQKLGVTLPGGGVASTDLPALVAARRRELATANENLARARALGRQQIRDARAVGQAEEEAARRTVRAQQQVVRSQRDRARESLRAARAAETDARAQERAAQRAEAAFRRQALAMGTTNNIASQLRNTIFRLVAAYSGFRAIEGFIAAGLKFNQIIETSRLGIGALITAQTKLFDVQGKQLTGTEALAAAQGLAADQLDKLRVAGIQTAATTEALVTTFEETVGAGLSVGLTLDQIRKFSVSIAQAAGAINLPMSQLQQESRSILQSTIDRNSRIAKMLNLTNAEVNLAKQQGRLYDLLNEKLSAFNVAGVESVKTFAVLKTTISDAFSVFAGRATEPLFRQIRDAGVQAVQGLFDFRSADIATSFQGLIDGLQILFNQIGGMLADAIRAAVEKAEVLSDWLRRNREEVKATAAAIRTMVEDFGRMVGAITSAITSVGTLGDSTNTVIGLARVLSALFQSIADNAQLIVNIITGAAVARAIRQLLLLRTLLTGGAAVAGGAAAGSALPGVGTIVGTIIGLGVAYKLMTGFQKELRLETARTTTAMQDQDQKASQLLGTITGLTRQINDQKTSEEDRASLNSQLASRIQELIALGPEYKKVIDDNTGSIDKQREALADLIQKKVTQAKVDAAFQFAQVEQLRKQRDAAATPVTRVVPGVRGEVQRITGVADPARLKELNQALEEGEAKLNVMRLAAQQLETALEAALSVPAKLRRDPTTQVDPNKDINDAVQRAQAELERTKDMNQARLDLARIQFKRGLITQIDVINGERDAALAEIDAEMKVLEAQREAAARRVIKGKVVPDQGAIDAANIKITGLQNKRVLVEQENDEKVEQARKDHLNAIAKIEEDFARVTGNRVKAIRSEIERKHQDELEAAIREFGPDSEQVVKIRFVIDQESIREQAEAIEEEIRRIEQQAQREIATAKLRILGPNAERGSGNAQQKQQLADAISAANAKAAKNTEELLNLLLQLKAAAADDDTRTFIQTLIDQIELLRKKSVEVDEQMRRLKEGLAEAFVSGVGDFLDSLTDKTKNVAESFKNMVRSILSDISRLVSRLLAEKIVFGIAGLFSGGGAVRGNLTQSQGRAEGGLARPPHGLLKGGFPGTDSIHIAAMPDEYFTQAKAVRHYGLEFFDAVNNMELPRINPRTFRPLAFGGTGMDSVGLTARPSTRQDVHHTIDVDEHGLLRVLNGRVGRDAVIGHVQKNPRVVGHAVNRGRRAR